MILAHLDTLAQSVKQLPESTWLDTAAKSVETVQGLAIRYEQTEGAQQES